MIYFDPDEAGQVIAGEAWEAVQAARVNGGSPTEIGKIWMRIVANGAPTVTIKHFGRDGSSRLISYRTPAA